ncbi:MAG: 1-acyl-sn-glycerol-3-phosphate acyltransferase [Deltaproteobacteria bacterium]|nr:1-acyl-sn-glycerol-3-phosphate acyltransferase [Deltaproteobacteria bacterium]
MSIGSLLARKLRPAQLLGRATDPLFRHIEVDEQWRAAVEAAVTRGPIVYVLRNVAAIDYLALSHLTGRLLLPPIGFVNELPEALGPAPARPDVPAADRLRRALESGESAVLFVKRAPRAGRTTQRGRSGAAALLRSLVELQASWPEREIVMVPQIFVWTQRAETRGYSLFDAFLGPADFPGELRRAAQCLLNHRNCRLRAGEPLSLRQFLEEQGGPGGPEGGAPGVAAEALVPRLTYALLRKIERERRGIVGPALKPADRVREQVLRSPELRSVIADLAGPGPRERALLTGKARGLLRQLQALPSPETQHSMVLALDAIFGRLFAGIDIDMAGLERLREAASQGSVVLLPSHRSHVDYLLLSYVLHRNAIQLPVIAAGENLSFFPLGPLLRRGGAFYIRRSFGNDRLYAAVVDAYLRRLVREGWMIEFFLEGGRSRTGKLLPPKYGLLASTVDAALQLRGRAVLFVPVSIGYERLMEEGAYERELSGHQKRPEDARALLKLGGLLIDRWGRVNVQFGRPVVLDDLRAQMGLSSETVSEGQRRELVRTLAHRVLSEINRVTAITPAAVVAMVLLSHAGRGLAYRDLLAQARRLTGMMIELGARTTPSLVRPGGELREEAVREMLRLCLKGGLLDQHVPGDTLTAEKRERDALYAGPEVIFTVPDAKRLRLDLLKNSLIHLVADRALMALALLCPNGIDAPDEFLAEDEPVTEADEADERAEAVAPAGEGLRLGRSALRHRVRTLSRLFKYEFMFRADATFERIFDELLAQMMSAGELVAAPAPAASAGAPAGGAGDDLIGAGPGHHDLDGRGWIAFYALAVLHFVEGYCIAARSLGALLRAPLSTKELTARALRVGEQMFLEGEIERAEAVSRPIIENALAAFCDLGYLVRDGSGRLALADSFQGKAALGSIEARVAAYLWRRRERDR